MDTAPFLELPLYIQLHAASATLAILIGPIAIYRKRRDRLHKSAGYLWVLSMLTVAITGLFIPSFGLAVVGHLGPIHLFVALTIVSLWQGMHAIFRGNITAHRAALSGLYWQGLILAGLFNFIPGRMTNRSLFPENPELGYVVMALGGALIVWIRFIKPRLRAPQQLTRA
ncbi:MAG: DUF2306 domain-containing protein [Paracoccaceae bacterium]